MIILGLILILIGALVPVPQLITVGIVVLIVGLALILLNAVGHPFAGRSRWY